MIEVKRNGWDQMAAYGEIGDWDEMSLCGDGVVDVKWVVGVILVVGRKLMVGVKWVDGEKLLVGVKWVVGVR